LIEQTNFDERMDEAKEKNCSDRPVSLSDKRPEIRSGKETGELDRMAGLLSSMMGDRANDE
jgi:hypothetical protein